ncbi:MULTISPECIES: DUF4062 domain-containing protein [unclassified Polaribacter]|uniref:DUF4062 domain-containing protein n=1 Tax=unclassified Polaribacter TaxID=196858 RepID=UPI0011BF0F92|nr:MULTISPECIES: DUF4062 domain-containing protein [unclassified Polaribacter]TXD52959.1 DUF4062 domain-containing protein [Polaribacter sp. IC063]TXD60949.1 DUF4062 domain-containing protein [Polaribacter sp. IC066]
METLKIFKCFISSPGDCEKEREICQTIINRINSGLARHLRVNFQLFMWEYDILPDMGKNGQEIIDEYIKKSNYDIFIGIMKNRFGHPTKKAGSGTQHEFNDALERKKSSQNSVPRIIFFFGKENVDLNNPNIEEIFEQHKKVKRFKTDISRNGIYIDFKSVNEFEQKLEDKLNLFISEYSPLSNPTEKLKEVDVVLKRLEEDLNESLKTYNEKSPIWINPIISTKRKVPANPSKNEENKIDLESFIENPSNIIIKAPSEFGLTSLAHYLKLNAWKAGKTFVYIDAKKTKKHKIVKEIPRETENYYFKKINSIDCIILDSVCFEENGIMQMIKNICDEYKNTPIILLNTLDNNFFLKSNEDDKVEIRRKFTSLYLLPLPQTEVRKIVTTYAKSKSFIEDTETTLLKVTRDLETLNMHRTAKNCISILRASSQMIDEYGPVNRTKLLETILNGVFQDYELPTYHEEKPDVKDCSFVLGYLCELLVLRKDFEFSDSFFKEKLTKFCNDHFITLDLNYLLNALKDNSIIGSTGSHSHYFKNSYWVFYFIAQRMNMNPKFRETIYRDKKYIDYPEIIEFYTGIDRNKEDALIVLSKDLEDTLQTVKSKVNIPNELNPFKSIQWNPDIPTLEKEEAKIGENVITSGLPDEVKDKYEDKNYNQTKPYNQVINSVMRDYSILILMRQISATSRALRNSDFVNDTNLKKELLNKITEGWNEINKLLIVLSPLLADKGNVTFEGASFSLNEDDFKISNPVQKRMAVLLALPSNIVRFFKDDIYSAKIGPLLIDKAVNESNSLIKHELMTLITAERPKNWRIVIDSYIVNLDKNSYFLSDLLIVLNFNIDFKATEIEDIKTLKMLAQKCRAKHLLKINNPDIGSINRLKKLESGSKY